MEASSPRLEEHCGLCIYAKLISPYTSTNVVKFNVVVERLKRIGAVNVVDAPFRCVTPTFATNLSETKTAWGEFQLHRKVLGFVGVAFSGVEDPGDNVLFQYANAKKSFRATLIDARLILFGPAEVLDRNGSGLSDQNDVGLLTYPNFESDDFRRLESDMRDYVKVLFWVLESRRLDLSFEQSDTPQCPMAPDEEKILVGVDKTTRAFRKRCVGRLKKQIADYTLIAGLPLYALDAYVAAIDALKSANDFLWLGGAYEGFVCAAILVKYNKTVAGHSLRRVSTFTSGQMKKICSEDVGDNRTLVEGQGYATTSISSEDIEEKIRLAVDNYRKFSVASGIECEFVLKCAWFFISENRFLALDAFIREFCCARFLNEDFHYFDDTLKAQVCVLIANVYKSINFERKNSFYLRLAALFRLHIGLDAPITEDDYRQVYPILLSSMSGYGLAMSSSKTAANAGWPAVRHRALHEVFAAAQRARYKDASCRHLAHFLHLMLEYFDDSSLRQLAGELATICQETKVHAASVHLRVVDNIILPPISLFKLPRILHFSVLPLPPYLHPKEVIVDEKEKIFIYTPFLNQNSSKKVLWVAGCTCAVEIKVQNPLPVELEVKNLVVQCEGVEYDASPTLLVLPPKSDSVTAKLLITPRSAGDLLITGYSCQVLNVKSVCRVEELYWLKHKTAPSVHVVPSLPDLSVGCSSPRASSDLPLEPTEVCSMEVSLFCGQKSFKKVLLQNVSNYRISQLNVELKQPAVSGGPSLLELAEGFEQLICIDSKNSFAFELSINGVDPLAVVDQDNPGDNNNEKAARDEMIKAIPYTGRLLVASVLFSYVGGEGERKYQRSCSLSLYITVTPVVVVVDWHVLPGENNVTRYLALDVINACESDVDIEYALDKSLTVQPKDICRVPVLIECCNMNDETFELPVARGPLAKAYMLAARRKILQRHLLNQLDVRWKMTSGEVGSVPLGYFMKSVSMERDDLIISPLSVVVNINGVTNSSVVEHPTSVGELNSLKLFLVFKEKLVLSGQVRLFCYQDLQNGLTLISDQTLFVGPDFYKISMDENESRFDASFLFLFLSEGVYKMEAKFDLISSSNSGAVDFPFSFPLLPIYTFNVCSKFI